MRNVAVIYTTCGKRGNPFAIVVTLRCDLVKLLGRANRANTLTLTVRRASYALVNVPLGPVASGSRYFYRVKNFLTRVKIIIAS